VNALRARLLFLVILACQLALLFGEAVPDSWWEGYP
jgi:hypothetical protein